MEGDGLVSVLTPLTHSLIGLLRLFPTAALQKRYSGSRAASIMAVSSRIRATGSCPSSVRSDRDLKILLI